MSDTVADACSAYTAPRTGKMSFAYFEDNGDVRPLPSVRRAMNTTIKALKAQGHQGLLRTGFVMV